MHDLLGSEPRIVLAAYRDVVADREAPRLHRLRAAARALPIAAAQSDDEGVAALAQALTDLGGGQPAARAAHLADRLTAAQHALRAWAAAPLTAESDLRPIAQRIAAEPWRTLDALSARAGSESAERPPGADGAEDARRRADDAREGEPTRPRTLQQRRWARDVLEWEMAGQRDKAARIFAALVRRRDGRAGLTLQRFEAELGRAKDLTETDRELLGRALAAARTRSRDGDTRGAGILCGAALTLLRTSR
ncbi:MAG: hypothetical protein R3F56_17150 [Planctomycetota bacterium]